jgi:hypothetical protein
MYDFREQIRALEDILKGRGPVAEHCPDCGGWRPQDHACTARVGTAVAEATIQALGAWLRS